MKKARNLTATTLLLIALAMGQGAQVEAVSLEATIQQTEITAS